MTETHILANDLDDILIGEPVSAMEAAKRIIQRGAVNPITFITLANGKPFRLWTRIAAIWLLGFVDHDAMSLPDLLRLSRDENELPEIRDHASEAIGNIEMCHHG